MVNVRIAELERVNRLDPLEVFTRVRRPGRASGRPRRQRQGRAARRRRRRSSTRRAGSRGFGSTPLVWVAPFRAERVGGRRQGVRPGGGTGAVRGERPGQDREASARRSSTSSTSPTRTTPVETALAAIRPRRRPAADLILTAGGRSHRSGGPVLRRDRRARRAGRPARRAGPPGLDALAGPHRPDGDPRACRPAAPTRRRPPPTCCCRGCCPASRRRRRRSSQARPWRRADPRERFRFPPYARELDAPDG